MEQYQQDIKAGFVQSSSSSLAPTKGQAVPTSTTPSPVSVGRAREGQAGAVASSPEAQAETLTTASGTVVKTSKPSSEPEVPEACAKPIVTRDETVGQPGEWQVVETPTPKQQGERGSGKGESGSHYVPGAEDDDGGEVDPEDLRSFKIEEKIYPVDSVLGEDGQDSGDGGSSAVVFKKRKAGASKPRNIRRKL